MLLMAGLTIAATGLKSAAQEPRVRPDAIERYGLEGFIQPIGLHHGFHIQMVVPNTPADRDRLMPHEIIVKVDGEPIRSLEHLRSLLIDVYEDDGEAMLTIMKDQTLEHHVVKCHLKPREEQPPVHRARLSDPEGDDRR
jgi:hypothetical protein